MNNTNHRYHAAVLQMVADQLRTDGVTVEKHALEACSRAIEMVAASLICARNPMASKNGLMPLFTQ